MEQALLSLLRQARTDATRGEYQAALTALGKALRIDPESASLWHEIGVVLTYAGEHEDALAAFEHAVHLNPGRASSHFQKGLLLTELGRAPEAREAFGAAVELTPDFEEVAAEIAEEIAEEDEEVPESGFRSVATVEALESRRKRTA
jgi:tetratricopeptide (TPR) repeat protein